MLYFPIQELTCHLKLSFSYKIRWCLADKFYVKLAQGSVRKALGRGGVEVESHIMYEGPRLCRPGASGLLEPVLALSMRKGIALRSWLTALWASGKSHARHM